MYRISVSYGSPSVQVIPGRGGKLEDTIVSMREVDERLQDANVRTYMYLWLHICNVCS